MEARRRWEELAFDCLICVFSKLGFEELTLGVPFVCKSWHIASIDPQCWRVLDFQDLDISTKSKFIGRFKQEYQVKSFSFSAFMRLCISRSCRSAVKLGIPSLGASLQQDLILASTECPRLKELALPTLLWHDDKPLPELISNWKELETLVMTWKPISFLQMLEQIKLNCPNFGELHLCGFFNRKDVQAMVRCLPKLKILVLSSSFLCKEDLLAIMDGCKELEVVDVSRCRGLDVDHEIMERITNYKKFEFEGCKSEAKYDNNYYIYDDLFLELAFGY